MALYLPVLTVYYQVHHGTVHASADCVYYQVHHPRKQDS